MSEEGRGTYVGVDLVCSRCPQPLLVCRLLSATSLMATTLVAWHAEQDKWR